MSLLFEDFGNLNRIDRSLIINDTESWNKGLQYDYRRGVGPNSEVKIIELRPHNFTSLINYIKNNNDISFIVLRCHKKQLLAISYGKNSGGYGRTYDNWSIKFTKLAWDKIGSNLSFPRTSRGTSSISNGITTDSEANAKSILSKTVTYFYNNIAKEGTIKQWDIIAVYKDDSISNTREERMKSKEGIVPLPHDENYKSFINRLKESFKERCREYILNNRHNYSSKEELINDIMNKGLIDEIKYKGINYKYNDANTILGDNDSNNYWEYKAVKADSNPDYIYVEFGYNGIIPFIKSIKAHDISSPSYGRWRASINDDEFSGERREGEREL